MSGRRFPARIRVIAAAAAALVVHVLFSRELEGVRLGIMCRIPALGGPGGLFGEAGTLPPDGPLRARIDAWRAARTRTLGAGGKVAVPVVDWRPEKQIAVIGAGRESGLEVHAPVVVPAGLLGFVEAVQPHLARVRLLSAPQARVAVTLAESRAGLPGGISTLNAVLEGTGDGARLVEGPLLSEFREGDRLQAAPGWDEKRGEERPVPVGTVTAAGVTPAVRLFASSGDLGLVAVASTATERPALFTDRVLEVRAAPLLGGAGALLGGSGSADVAAGCAVHCGGRYVGRVVRAGGSGAVASRLGDPGHRVVVTCLGATASTSDAQLVALGDGLFRIDGAVPDEPSVIALTAGGQDLVPGDLAIGVLERDMGCVGCWRLRDSVEPWPATVTVSVFTFGAELQRLILR